MMRPEFMPELKKEVLEDLIKYLRSLEMKGKGDQEMKGEAMIAAMPVKEEGEDEDKLEEPNLDMEDEESDDPGLNETQMKVKDFFNNVRPRSGTSMKKGRVMRASPEMTSKKGSRLMGKGK